MSRGYPPRCTYLALAFLVGCSASFSVPDGALVTCKADAECPSDVPVCAVTGLCVSRELVGENGPTLVRATPVSATTVVVEYDLQLLADSVSAIDSYRIDGLTVIAGALRADNMSVLLETSAQVPAVSYRLTTPGVRDIAGRANTEAAIDFRGFGLSPDELAPDLVTPPDNAQLRSITVELSWSGRAAATKYFIEITRDPGFATLAIDRIEVAAPTNRYAVTFPDSGTYYWRVTSDVQSATADMQARALHLFEDAIYVACPEGMADCSGGFGTREQPLRSIGAALALSADAAIGTVLVAGRTTPYRESLIVQQPVSIVCAYDAGFTESNVTHPTTVESVNALGALFVSTVTSLEVRACNFTDSFGAAAVSMVGSTDIRFDRVSISSTALDNVAALSLLNTAATIQDTIIRLTNPAVAVPGRGAARDVAVVRVDRSTLELVDSEVHGPLAVSPIGIQAFASDVRLEGVIVESGSKSPTSTESGIGIGIVVDASNLATYASRIFTGTGFSRVIGVDSRPESTLAIASTLIATGSGTTTSRALQVEGRNDAIVTNSILFGGTSGGGAVALDANIRSGTFSAYHSMFVGAPGSDSPAVIVARLGNREVSCNPYDYAFVNNIIVASGNGLGNLMAIGSVDDDIDDGTLLLNNAFFTLAQASSFRYSDTSTNDPSTFGCGTDSQLNVFLGRSITQLLPSLAGPDNDTTTPADNDYRPAPTDRAFLRAGRVTSGMCASQPCERVTADFTGAIRTSSPPTIGPFDFP